MKPFTKGVCQIIRHVLFFVSHAFIPIKSLVAMSIIIRFMRDECRQVYRSANVPDGVSMQGQVSVNVVPQ